MFVLLSNIIINIQFFGASALQTSDYFEIIFRLAKNKSEQNC
jgi:hypothetical protein